MEVTEAEYEPKTDEVLLFIADTYVAALLLSPFRNCTDVPTTTEPDTILPGMMLTFTGPDSAAILTARVLTNCITQLGKMLHRATKPDVAYPEADCCSCCHRSEFCKCTCACALTSNVAMVNPERVCTAVTTGIVDAVDIVDDTCKHQL